MCRSRDIERILGGVAAVMVMVQCMLVFVRRWAVVIFDFDPDARQTIS